MTHTHLTPLLIFHKLYSFPDMSHALIFLSRFATQIYTSLYCRYGWHSYTPLEIWQTHTSLSPDMAHILTLFSRFGILDNTLLSSFNIYLTLHPYLGTKIGSHPSFRFVGHKVNSSNSHVFYLWHM
jgi:hypothetical protein